MGYNSHLGGNLDNKDFFQVMWHYDRLMKQKNMEIHGADGSNLLNNGISNLDNAMGDMNG